MSQVDESSWTFSWNANETKEEPVELHDFRQLRMTFLEFVYISPFSRLSSKLAEAFLS